MADIIVSELNQPKERLILTEDEKAILKKIRNKRVLFILSAYLGLAYVLVDAWTRVFHNYPYWGLLELFQFRFYLSQFILFLFLLLTIFFLKYYLQAAHPFTKDIKAGMKDVIYFIPERYKTPFFEEYFLQTPLKKRALVKINKELYDAIQTHTTACLHLSPHAKYIFLVDVNNRKMNFNESNALVDI